MVIAAVRFSHCASAQHDAGYAQYMFNGLVLNPAYAGSNEALTTTLSHKNQWTGLNVAPKTTALGLHSPLGKGSSNIGVMVVDDRFGLTIKNRMVGSYAYRIKLGRECFLRFGLQAGLETQRNDLSKLITVESNDRSFMNLTPNAAYFTSGAGVYAHSRDFFAGISAPMLYHGNLEGVHSYKPLFFYGGYRLKLNTVWMVQPSFLVKYLRSSPTQVDANLLVSYREKVGAGLSYRSNQTLVATSFYQINQQFFIGYAYELNLAKTFVLPRNSHELVLKYTFAYYRNIKSPVTFY